MNTNFFTPSSVVVIGASSTAGKVGNDLLKNLKNFSGEIFGVNPKGGHFEDITFFPSLSKISTIPDLALIAIPARFVAQSLE